MRSKAGDTTSFDQCVKLGQPDCDPKENHSNNSNALFMIVKEYKGNALSNIKQDFQKKIVQ